MLYQISSDTNGNLQPVSTSPHAGWLDGVRVRMFEYPLIEARHAANVGAGEVGPTGTWHLDHAQEYLVYNKFHRIRGAASTAFVPALGTGFAQTYPHDLLPGGSPAAAVDELFKPSTDWWDRSWIYCDQVLAAIHIESLRFGKKRRTGNDNAFDAAVIAHTRGWAQLRPLLPNVPGDPRLMADDATKPPAEPRLFSNGPMPQVQLGDHVVFWNSIMYGLLSDGAWSLENAVVVDLQSDWSSSDIADSTRLMGHGTDETFAGRFREELKRALDKMLAAARVRRRPRPLTALTCYGRLHRWFAGHRSTSHGSTKRGSRKCPGGSASPSSKLQTGWDARSAATPRFIPCRIASNTTLQRVSSVPLLHRREAAR